jgi:hypothetical protein
MDGKEEVTMYTGLGAYYLKNGQPASVLYVGDTMGFNVPGYSQIWLDQKQNGTTQYSGPFNLPMPAYTLLPRDAGYFQATIYALNPDGTKGNAIGADSIQVLPATSPTTCPPGYIMTSVVNGAEHSQCMPFNPPPMISQIPAPGYQPSSPPSSGGRILPTGIPTPSLPSPTILFSPSAPIDYGSIPPGTTAETGMGISPLALLLIVGLGIGLFMKRR